MSEIPSRLLLYPQNLLFPEKAEKIFSLVSKIAILKLSKTFNIMEDIYKDSPLSWKERITFLELKEEVKVNWDQIEKEVDTIEEWGLNFRTPENLKYFSQFKETLEESLEGLFPTLKKKENREKAEEELKIRKALILLSLAEKLDFRLYELERSLKEMEKKYNQIFEEKIIGEDKTFEKILDIKEPLSSYLSEEGLPNLNLRIFAWKIIGKYLNWKLVEPLNGLLITEKDLLEEWKEKFSFEKEKIQKEKSEIYRFKKSIFELLDISEIPSLRPYSSETVVVFLQP